MFHAAQKFIILFTTALSLVCTFSQLNPNDKLKHICFKIN
jgi:hypothetical protein